MTVFVDWQIKKLCEQGMINPFIPEHINPSSIDVCIGISAMVDTVNGFENHAQFDLYTKEKPYPLQPNECMLVSTMETLKLPSHIAAELKLKSSRAREGLSHALAGWIDNGFHGILTLELKNYSTKHCVNIYPGLRVGQLKIINTALPEKTYLNGRYAGKTTVLGSLDG